MIPTSSHGAAGRCDFLEVTDWPGRSALLFPRAFLQVAPEASAAREYLDKHNLVEFTQLLVQSAARFAREVAPLRGIGAPTWDLPRHFLPSQVIKEQPEQPYEFMARQLPAYNTI